MSAKQRLHDLVEQLPASEIEKAVQLLESLVEAPVDPEMLARIDVARQRRGAGISLECEEQQSRAKLQELRTAIDEGDASGVAEGDVFGRLRKTLKLARTPR